MVQDSVKSKLSKEIRAAVGERKGRCISSLENSGKLIC
jgi:hypothetical protein